MKNRGKSDFHHNPSMPTEEINPAKTLESYYRRSKEKRKSMTNKPLNDFII